MRACWAMALLVAGLVMSDAALGASRQVAVFTDGRAMPLSSGKAAFSCQDEDLAFVFTETVNGGEPPQVLTLEESEQESGEGNVRVEITQTCGGGEAIFNYEHASAGATAEDLTNSPEQFSISVPTTEGASASRTVSYQALDDDESEDEEAVFLIGNQIVFFVNNTAGQSSFRRDLLEIRIPANSENVVDPDNLPDNTPEEERDAVDALNDACRGAEPGSELAATCDEIQEAQDSDGDAPGEPRGEQVRRIARAVDPHLATVAAASTVESGRIQHENIRDRLTALRQGERGITMSSLRLAMGGRTISMGWIQDYLDAEAESGGGTRLLSEKWGLFVDGSVSVGDRDDRGKEPGFDFDSYNLTGGVDYRFDNGLILGSAVGFTRYDSDVDRDGGGLESDSYTIQGFGTYNLTDSFYVDATAAYSAGDLDQRRVIDLSGVGSLGRQTATGETDSDQISASLAANYATNFGAGWSLVYYGSIYYADTTIDAFSERGSPLGLSFEEQNFESMLSSLGLRVSKVINLENGVLTPFADIAFEHESRYDAFEIKTRFTEADAEGPSAFISDPDRDFGRAAVGAAWVFPSGNQLFFRFNTLFLDKHTDRYSLYMGGRFEF